MSKYTTEVRFICETYAGNLEQQGYSSIENTIEIARRHVFDFDYPIFDTQYKGVIETKILKHFYTREICEETIGLWKLRLNTKMNEIMPYFNTLYSAVSILDNDENFNPFNTINYGTDYTDHKQETGNGTSNGTYSGSSESETNRTDNTTNSESTSRSDNNTNSESTNGTYYKLYSDTPQGSLSGVNAENYLTNATKDTTTESTNGTYSGSSETTTNGTGTSTGTETGNTSDTSTTTNTRTTIVNTNSDYVKSVRGYQGQKTSYQMLNDISKELINIDMMVINELNDLFFGLWA